MKHSVALTKFRRLNVVPDCCSNQNNAVSHFMCTCPHSETINSSWSANQGDSASSSDETSSANGDSLFSMFSGPDLVAAVKQRRSV